MAEASQEHRAIAVESPLGPDVLLLRRMNGAEALSRLFEFELDLLSQDAAIKGDDLLGQNISVRMLLTSGDTRYFNGYVSSFRAVPGSGQFSQYELSIRPWLWFLSKTSDCRIFQQMSVPDVVKQVFRDRGFSDFETRLSATYRTHEYLVQFRETDLNFISRLLEFEGIYYYFEHENGKHTLILCDGYAAHEPCPGYSDVKYFPPDDNVLRECLHSWTVSHSLQSTSYLVNAFDFEKPTSSLRARRNVERTHTNNELELYDPEDRYTVHADGEEYAKKRVEQLASQFEVISAAGNVRGLTAGGLFNLTEFPIEAQKREYLLVSVAHRIESDAYASGGGSAPSQYACSVEAIDAKQPFRPPQLAPKPEISGPQTAIVTGPGGEEIWTDKYGRVKVQFHWDHYGKADENSSCWIRVAQEWAGKNWGSVHLPRVGHEVLVNFLEGDPDRPIITGRVYNGDNPTPYELPKEKTKSGIKSNSSKGGAGFNELRFEDEKGKEQLFMHAEKNFDLRVNNQRRENIDGERHLTVAKHRIEQVGEDMHLTVAGDHFEMVEGDQHLTFKADRFMDIDSNNNRIVGADENIDISGDLNLKQGANHNQETGMVYSLKAGTNVVIEAGMSLTLKVGGNFINISPAGVAIKGAMVMINSGGSAGKGPQKPAKPDKPEEPEEPKPADTAEAGSVAKAKKANPEKPKEAMTGTVKVSDFTDPQAKVLAAAAESGTPFCEECERARQSGARS